MAGKNKIKINSFSIVKMEQTHANEVLRLAVKTQSSFRISETESPSLFLQENKNLILENIKYSFVYKDNKDKVFGAIIIQPETNISAEILVLMDPNIIAGHEMYNEFKKLISSLKFKSIFIKALKRRKNFEKYLNFSKFFGFSEVLNENELFVILGFKKH
jgi:hypothetical protein